jgi:hypothetical protein
MGLHIHVILHPRNVASKYKGAQENLVSLTYMELTETKERSNDTYLLPEHWRII